MGFINNPSIDPKSWAATVGEVVTSGDFLEVSVKLSNNLGSDLIRYRISLNGPNQKKALEDQIRQTIHGDDNIKNTKLTVYPGLILDVTDPIVVTPAPNPTRDQFLIDLNNLRKIERNPNISTGLDLNTIKASMNTAIGKDSTLKDLL